MLRLLLSTLGQQNGLCSNGLHIVVSGQGLATKQGFWHWLLRHTLILLQSTSAAHCLPGRGSATVSYGYKQLI